MATAREKFPFAYMEGEEDPRTRKRTVPLEVISANYSRTGTMSMKAAFETLGIPTFHNVTMSANPPDIDYWSDALLAKFDPKLAASKGIKPFGRKEFDNLLGYWGATTDQPAAVMTEELVKAYPDVKVVLAERDVDKWHKSYCETVIDGTGNPWIPLASHLDPVFMKRMTRFTDLQNYALFNIKAPRVRYGLFNNQEYFDEYRANAKEMYRKHQEMVKRVVPKDRLLIFKLEQGWKPLCEFLGKPIPDVPFPKVNETEAAQEMIKVYVGNSYKRALRRLAMRASIVLGIALAAAVWWWRQ